MKVACILDAGTYKPGDLPPAGYVQWHEWADAQHKAGLRQKQCGRCGLWRFPQQLSAATVSYTTQSRKGPQTITAPLCKQCNPDGVPGTHNIPNGEPS